MLHTISWTAYLQYILCLLILYYTAVVLLYFRSDIRWQLLRYQQGFYKRTLENSNSGMPAASTTNEESNSLFTSAQNLLATLKQVFGNAARQHFQKEELLVALQFQLQRHTELRGTAFEVAINNQIMQQCYTECAITIEESDIKNLWKPMNAAAYQ